MGNYRQITLAEEAIDQEAGGSRFSEAKYDFHNLFSVPIAEEHQQSCNSMAILGDSLSVLKKNERKVRSAYFCRRPL